MSVAGLTASNCLVFVSIREFRISSKRGGGLKSDKTVKVNRQESPILIWWQHHRDILITMITIILPFLPLIGYIISSHVKYYRNHRNQIWIDTCFFFWRRSVNYFEIWNSRWKAKSEFLLHFQLSSSNKVSIVRYWKGQTHSLYDVYTVYILFCWCLLCLLLLLRITTLLLSQVWDWGGLGWLGEGDLRGG